MSRRLALLLLPALSMGIPAVAVADEPSTPTPFPVALGTDEILLKNGGMLRGTVVGIDPGREVVLVPGGASESRVVPWDEIADVRRGKYAEPAPPPSVPMPAPMPPSPPLGAPGVVRLHIDSPKPVQLQEIAASGVVATSLPWSPTFGPGYMSATVTMTRSVCASPCDRIIDGRSGSRFVVAGDGITSTEQFLLSEQRGDVTLDLDPGSRWVRRGGVGLTIAGGVGMVVGGILIVVGATSNDRMSRPLVPIAGVAVGVSGAMLISGIVMIVGSRSTYELRPTTVTTASHRPEPVRPRYWLGEF
jgi:hypothetical protein